METNVAKWGNSLGIRIPQACVEEAGLKEGTKVDVQAHNGEIVIRPVIHYCLDDLLALVTPENRHGEVFSDGPRGREEW